MSKGEKADMEIQSCIMAHGDQRPARTPLLSLKQRSSSILRFFYKAVVQHVTYVTDFSRVGRVVSCTPFMGNNPPDFSFFWHGCPSCSATCQITQQDVPCQK